MRNESISQKQVRVYSWGFGKYGQIGSTDFLYSYFPIELNLQKQEKCEESEIRISPNIVPDKIVCGEFHTMLIDKNQLYSFGKNTFGQLGTGDTYISSFPRKVIFKESVKITKVACGGEHTIALSSLNKLYSWGLNIYGQLGLNHNGNVYSPNKIAKFCILDPVENQINDKESNNIDITESEKIEEIAAGSHHSFILTEKNKLFSCGYNKYSALGLYREIPRNRENIDIEYLSDRFIFTQMNTLCFKRKKISNIVCGPNHSGCILGKNEFSIWGGGDFLNFRIPFVFKYHPAEKEKVPFKCVNQLLIGLSFVVVVVDDEHIFTIGTNNYYELGNLNQKSNKEHFCKVSIKEPIKELTVGYSHVLAITTNNKVYGWGCNKHGQLGDPNLDRLLPKEITLLSELSPIKIVAGGYHSAIISITKNFRNVSMIKTVPLNKGFNLDFVEGHIRYIKSILEIQEHRKKEIEDQEKILDKLNKNIEKLKITALKPKRSERDKETIPQEINKFEEDVKLSELEFFDEKTGNLGSGTFGEVKKAYWRKTLVAVKFLRVSTDPKDNEKNIQSFIEELNILKKLRHPNILLYLAACTSGPKYFLITELCELGSLFHWLHEETDRSMLTDIERIDIALDIAKGVNYLHSFNPPILHRDLKSLNILLTKHRQVRIADFGWARLRQDHMTKKRGTFQWMAPELIKYNKYSEKADVFSFAIILWELFCQVYPYDKIDQKEVARNVVNDPNFRPQIMDFIPTNVVALMKNCWSHNPDERYSFDIIIDKLNSIKKELVKTN